MPPIKFSVERKETLTALKLFVNGILHLSVDKDKLVAISSWIEDGGSKYVVEYTFDGGATVMTEYDSGAKFQAVLAVVEGWV